MRVCVVIPSIGRESLVRAVKSAGWADEVFVVYDGPDVPAREDLPRGTRIAFHPQHEASANWGMEQRNWALGVLAQGKWNVTHASFMDDDDVYAPGAGEAIRAAVEREPEAMHVFCMRRPGGEVIGRHQRVECGFVGTPMMVVPVGRHGVWGDRYEGDCDFALSAAALLPVVWHPEVIALIGGAADE